MAAAIVAQHQKYWSLGRVTAPSQVEPTLKEGTQWGSQNCETDSAEWEDLLSQALIPETASTASFKEIKQGYLK